MFKQRVFIKNYNVVADLERIYTYFMGEKKYHVYLITVDEKNKLVHDEQEKGKIHWLNAKEINHLLKDVRKTLSVIKNKVNELERTNCCYHMDLNIQVKKLENVEAELVEILNDILGVAAIKEEIANDTEEQEEYITRYLLGTDRGYFKSTEGRNVFFTMHKSDAFLFHEETHARRVVEKYGLHEIFDSIEKVKVPFKKEEVKEENATSNNEIPKELTEFFKKIFPGAEVRLINMKDIKNMPKGFNPFNHLR